MESWTFAELAEILKKQEVEEKDLYNKSLRELEETVKALQSLRIDLEGELFEGIGDSVKLLYRLRNTLISLNSVRHSNDTIRNTTKG